jgi:hypothetical protein
MDTDDPALLAIASAAAQAASTAGWGGTAIAMEAACEGPAEPETDTEADDATDESSVTAWGCRCG